MTIESETESTDRLEPAASKQRPAESVIKRVRWAEAVLALALILDAGLAALARHYAYFEWDLNLERWIQSIHAFGFDVLMRAVSLLGDGWRPFGLVMAAGVLLFLVKLRLEGLTLLTGLGLGAVLNSVIKGIVGRPRPSRFLVQVSAGDHLESFPSGHVVFFVEFFGFIFFLSYVLIGRGPVRTGVIALCVAAVSIIGVSRVYLGAHWPSDVAGAYLSGGIWLFLMIEVYRRLKTRRYGEREKRPGAA